MQVFSSRTNQHWLAEMTPPPAGAAPAGGVAHQDPLAITTEDPAFAEAKRALSDILRCGNLMVLAGLGTSLCVQPAAPGSARAPTMWNLWQRVEAKQDAASAAVAPPGPTFVELLQMVGHPQDKTDIEALMSRCRLAESFLAG
jgi:hypothetical protein